MMMLEATRTRRSADAGRKAPVNFSSCGGTGHTVESSRDVQLVARQRRRGRTRARNGGAHAAIKRHRSDSYFKFLFALSSSRNGHPEHRAEKDHWTLT